MPWFIYTSEKTKCIFDWGNQFIGLQNITNESKTQEAYKVFKKTIGQSHKNHELNSETIL